MKMLQQLRSSTPAVRGAEWFDGVARSAMFCSLKKVLNYPEATASQELDNFVEQMNTDIDVWLFDLSYSHSLSLWNWPLWNCNHFFDESVDEQNIIIIINYLYNVIFVYMCLKCVSLEFWIAD